MPSVADKKKQIEAARAVMEQQRQEAEEKLARELEELDRLEEEERRVEEARKAEEEFRKRGAMSEETDVMGPCWSCLQRKVVCERPTTGRSMSCARCAKLKKRCGMTEGESKKATGTRSSKPSSEKTEGKLSVAERLEKVERELAEMRRMITSSSYSMRQEVRFVQGRGGPVLAAGLETAETSEEENEVHWEGWQGIDT